jgi:hypothetical protein
VQSPPGQPVQKDHAHTPAQNANAQDLILRAARIKVKQNNKHDWYGDRVRTLLRGEQPVERCDAGDRWPLPGEPWHTDVFGKHMGVYHSGRYTVIFNLPSAFNGTNVMVSSPFPCSKVPSAWLELQKQSASPYYRVRVTVPHVLMTCGGSVDGANASGTYSFWYD